MKILVPSNKIMIGLLGVKDININLIESAFKGTVISVRGNEITLKGDEMKVVAEVIDELITLLERGHDINEYKLSKVLDIHLANHSFSNGGNTAVHGLMPNGESEKLIDILDNEILRSPKGASIYPKSLGQQRYVEAIKRNHITFGLGPAGTGKSWLAVAMAVKALKEKEVKQIVMTRPAVETGEKLGFLPGDVMAKVDPYLRPLYDAMVEFQTHEGMNRLLSQGVLEVAPLAFMRGRTLNNSFVILDEAQNTTPEQMKMFLTRMGFGSKSVITGDTTQVDVPNNKSGLVDLEVILGGIEGLEFVHLSSKDVVRHPIVSQIVNVYDKCR